MAVPYFLAEHLTPGLQATHWLRKDWGVGVVIETRTVVSVGNEALVRWAAGHESWHKLQELRGAHVSKRVILKTARGIRGPRRERRA